MSCAFTDCSMGVSECSRRVSFKPDYIPLSWFVVSILFIFPRSESLHVLLRLLSLLTIFMLAM